jgi:hypothetical protein
LPCSDALTNFAELKKKAVFSLEKAREKHPAAQVQHSKPNRPNKIYVNDLLKLVTRTIQLSEFFEIRVLTQWGSELLYRMFGGTPIGYLMINFSQRMGVKLSALRFRLVKFLT